MVGHLAIARPTPARRTLKFDTLHLPFGSLCCARQAVQQKWPEQSLHTLPAAHVTYALILCPLLPCGLVQAAPKMQRMRPAGKIMNCAG
jgi:hypothetical protein